MSVGRRRDLNQVSEQPTGTFHGTAMGIVSTVVSYFEEGEEEEEQDAPTTIVSYKLRGLSLPLSSRPQGFSCAEVEPITAICRLFLASGRVPAIGGGSGGDGGGGSGGGGGSQSRSSYIPPSFVPSRRRCVSTAALGPIGSVLRSSPHPGHPTRSQP